MIKLIAISTIILSCAALSNNASQPNVSEKDMNTTTDTNRTIHQFKVASLDGGMIDFASFKGKKILVVNTASECGYTPQYKDLEELYEKYKDKFVIVGFPTNDFGGQEPGSNEEIKSFCQKNYGVTFPMAAKISVKGEETAAVYKWLTNKEQNGVLDATIKWNFNKFLLDENGHMIAYFGSKVKPMSEEILSKL